MPINIKIANKVLTETSHVVNTSIPVSIGNQQLSDHHLEELQTSGIDEELIRTNYRSIRGSEVVNTLNLHTLSKHHRMAVYGDVCAYGGRLCLSGNIYKPDKPRTDRKNRVVKYENPVDQPPIPILLKVPEKLAQKIADNVGVAKPENVYFWDWVLENPSVPVAIVEGDKKAASLMTNGLIPTIAVTGHTVCISKETNEVIFSTFVRGNREIILCLDNDEKLSAKQSVNLTIKKIIKAIKDKCQLQIVNHIYSEKGIDDIWLVHGQDGVRKTLHSKVKPNQWIDTSIIGLGYDADITLSQRYLPTLVLPKMESNTEDKIVLPENESVIVVKAPKGSGKTQSLTELIAYSKAHKMPSLVVTHRKELSRGNAKRWNITYIDDLEKNVGEVNNVALVIDSLPKINVNKYKGGLVIIDEFVQVLEHFNFGDTCKYKRPEILHTLHQLITTVIESGGKVILLDADADKKSIDYVCGLAQIPKAFIIENQYCQNSYKCLLSHGYLTTIGKRQRQTPIDVIALALSYAKQDKKLFICVTAQKEESNWSSTNLESLLHQYGITSVIRIDSHTIQTPNHPAFRATSNINNICNSYQVVIATPSLGTGVSIENKASFDYVFGVFTGVGSPDAARQFLMRVRDTNAQRIVYCAEESIQEDYLHLGSSTKTISQRQNELLTFAKDYLIEFDKTTLIEYSDIKANQTTQFYFNSTVEYINSTKYNYREFFKFGLKSEKVFLEETEDLTALLGDINLNSLYNDLVNIKTENTKIKTENIVNAKLLTDEQLTQTKKADGLTDNDRCNVEHTVISNRYCGYPVTEELLELDKKYEQIRLHYLITDGYEPFKQINALRGNNEISFCKGEVIEHDFIDNQKLNIQVEFLRQLDVHELVDNTTKEYFVNPDDAYFGDDTETKDILENLNFNHDEFKLVFNQRCEKLENTDIQILTRVLKVLDIKMSYKQPQIGDKRIRKYRVSKPNDIRYEIFQLWKTRDTEKAALWDKRKQELLIRIASQAITSDISITEFEQLQKKANFNDVWEQVPSFTRIKIINKVDNYKLPANNKHFILVSNDQEVEQAFSVIDQWQTVSLDVETFGNDKRNKEGLHKIKGQIRLLQLSNGYETYTFDFGKRHDPVRTTNITKLILYIQSLLGNKKRTIIGHNLNFDLGIIQNTFSPTMDCQIKDTLLGIQIFLGAYNGQEVWRGFGYGLGNLVQKFLGIKIDKTEQKSDWGIELTNSQVDYAANDPFYTYWLAHRLDEVYSDPTKFGFAKLAKWNMRKAWELECNVLIPIAEMERNGLPVDVKILNAMIVDINEKITTVLANWKELLPNIKRPTMRDKLLEHLNTKYNLSLQEIGKKSLSKYKELPEVEMRFQYLGLLNYLARLKKFVKATADGRQRINTFWSPLTGTGRTSSGGKFDDIVNIQSIPTKVSDDLENLGIEESIRSIVRPRKSEALLVSDLAAAHARIACDFAQDKLGMKVQNEDVDAHSLFALNIANCIPDEIKQVGLPDRFIGKTVTINDIDILNDFKKSSKSINACKKLRDCSKNIFYAKLNFASWRRMQQELMGQLKIAVTDQQAQAVSACFDALYPELTTYCHTIIEKLQLPENQIWIDGTLFGINEIAETGQRLLFNLNVNSSRQIKIPSTKCVASPWSRTEATAMKKSLILCHKIFRKHPDWKAQIINFVHDEIGVVCDEQYKMQVGKVLAWVMARNMQAELKNGVLHGCADFRNNTSIESQIVKSWAGK
ncbi:plasmid replication protein, CyRepA1 family [Scytonema sp. NUACC26]|uniref:plasmid replication protein, CyRepA1 family n=1 Tax=Scytonema sp. NUACC26 TaxID=3140176 RepID=UPI0038B299D8